MELLKLYRCDTHCMALHKEGSQLYYTISHRGVFDRKARPTQSWKMFLDLMEYDLRHCGINYQPVPLLVSRYDGDLRHFETPDDLERYYSGIGVDATRAADCLRNNLPVIFGRLTVHRERPWHFNDGLVAQRFGKRSAM